MDKFALTEKKFEEREFQGARAKSAHVLRLEGGWWRLTRKAQCGWS